MGGVRVETYSFCVKPENDWPVGSPVIVGDNLYLLSEPHDVICVRKSDGTGCESLCCLKSSVCLNGRTCEVPADPEIGFGYCTGPVVVDAGTHD